MSPTRTLWRYLRLHHVSLLALFIALGGTSYAAVQVERNSVGTQQIKNAGVRSPDLAANAVTTPKLKKGAVTGDKIGADRLTGANVLESSLDKVPSATNADNAQRAAVAATIESASVKTASVANTPNQVSAGSVTCNPGLTAVALGVLVDDPSDQFIIDSFPTAPNSWTARVANTGAAPHNFTLILSCVSVGSVIAG